MSETQNRIKTWQIFAVGGIAILIILLVTVIVVGVTNIFRIITFFLEILLFIVALFLLGWLFYVIFIKKKKFDVVNVNKKKLIQAGNKYDVKNLKNLYVSGDSKHSRSLIGRISGYCRIQILKKNYLYEDALNKDTGEKIKRIKTFVDDKGEERPVYSLDKEEQDVFIVKNGFLAGLFSDPMVIRVSPEEHDELVGDVTIYGYSLIPISEYWFLNNDYIDVRKIDYAILKEAERGIMFESLRDMKEIVDKASGLDSSHQKGIERQNMVVTAGDQISSK